MKSWLKSSKLRIAVMAGFVLLGFVFGQRIPISEQLPLYEGLRTTAAIIFAVVGAWVTLIYPRVLGRILDKSADANEPEVQSVLRLFKPAVFSTVVLGAVIIVPLVTPVLRQFSILLAFADYLRGLSFAILCFLSLLLLWSLVLTLIPIEYFQGELFSLQRRKQYLNGLHRRKSGT